ncbi:MAG TPA: alpha/beta hydrolase [Candidatus Paceibacterota bacterium]|jgi:alpha-beta hydrolase superfamily lysophospholipase|nr:alpha/beta hydrolase [Candidatus Paceibacterota bacterium]
MTPAYVVQITTPKKVLLDGLWLGPRKPKKVIVWVHGLGSTMFKKFEIMRHMTDTQTAVLTFNNRGHDKITRGWTASGRTLRIGSAHEVFTDCADDIEGAIRFARSRGAKRIYLVGHSTGCQKSVYWAAKKGKGVQGLVLLSPISDYATEIMAAGNSKIKRAEKAARAYIKAGRKHELLPESIWGWPWIADAQRFMSLYTGKSQEEVFPYWIPERPPRTLRSVKTPTLVILGEHEEYADRPVEEIAAWFEKSLKNKHKIVIVPKAGHSFRRAEKRVAKELVDFMKEV